MKKVIINDKKLNKAISKLIQKEDNANSYQYIKLLEKKSKLRAIYNANYFTKLNVNFSTNKLEIALLKGFKKGIKGYKIDAIKNRLIQSRAKDSHSQELFKHYSIILAK